MKSGGSSVKISLKKKKKGEARGSSRSISYTCSNVFDVFLSLAESFLFLLQCSIFSDFDAFLSTKSMVCWEKVDLEKLGFLFFKRVVLEDVPFDECFDLAFPLLSTYGISTGQPLSLLYLTNLSRSKMTSPFRHSNSLNRKLSDGQRSSSLGEARSDSWICLLGKLLLRAK